MAITRTRRSTLERRCLSKSAKRLFKKSGKAMFKAVYLAECHQKNRKALSWRNVVDEYINLFSIDTKQH